MEPKGEGAIEEPKREWWAIREHKLEDEIASLRTAKETAEAEVERLRQELIETQHLGMDWSERAETAERRIMVWRDRWDKAENALTHSEAERGRLEEALKAARHDMRWAANLLERDHEATHLLASDHTAAWRVLTTALSDSQEKRDG